MDSSQLLPKAYQATMTTTTSQNVGIPASANGTVVVAGSSAGITDAAGNTWTVSSGTVSVNGTAAGFSANVAQIAYVDGIVWQENTSGEWWGWEGSGWTIGNGTTTSPLPLPSANDTVVEAGSAAAITDTAGDLWTITAGGQVAVNGTADTTTANVTELAYVNGQVWQENSADLWWEKALPTDTWNPFLSGTAASPLPVASANNTVVLASTTGSIIDASNNAWTITDGGQVAVNGVIDSTTANVTELAYVNGAVWQENANDLWWSKTTPTNQWGPDLVGTSTSPVPATSTSEAITVTANGITQSAGTITSVTTTTVAGDAFTLTAGVIRATLGAGGTLISFVGATNINLTGGSGGAIISASAGQNTFTSGEGPMDITGGTGADSYVFHPGGGFLAIEDFAASKGDTLTIDSSLQTSMQQGSDGSGGTLISFGGTNAIDLINVASLGASDIHWK